MTIMPFEQFIEYFAKQFWTGDYNSKTQIQNKNVPFKTEKKDTP